VRSVGNVGGAAAHGVGGHGVCVRNPAAGFGRADGVRGGADGDDLADRECVEFVV